MPDQKQPLRWSRESQTWVPSGDRIFGKVSWDEKKGIVLDINGVLLAMEDFQRTLGVYEGWFFEVKFFDAADIEAPPPSGRM